MFALPTQKIKVTTTPTIGILAAHIRAMLIDGALAFGWMKEAAGAFVNGIFAMLEDAPVAFHHLGEFLFGLFGRKVKALSQSLHIAFRHDDVIVRTAIARAFGAIIQRF